LLVYCSVELFLLLLLFLFPLSIFHFISYFLSLLFSRSKKKHGNKGSLLKQMLAANEAKQRKTPNSLSLSDFLKSVN